MPKVLNKRTDIIPKDAIYVGRPSKWGNHFVIGEMSRENVVKAYKAYLDTKPSFKEEIRKELKGKDLVCWCAPEACHADVLLEIANAKL